LQEKEVLELLHRRSRLPFQIWMTRDVWTALSRSGEDFCAGSEQQQTPFSEGLLQVSNPDICWICTADGPSGLLVKKSFLPSIVPSGRQGILARQPKEVHPEYPESFFFPLRDSKLLQSYQKITEHLAACGLTQIPKSSSLKLCWKIFRSG